MILNDSNEELVPKFFGILEEVSFDTVDETLIGVLLKKEIIFISNLNSGFSFNSEEFEVPLYFNGVIYSFNDEFLEEVYLCLSFCINYDALGIQVDREKLIYRLDGFIGKDEKLKYLKQEHQKQFPESDLYSLYDDNLVSRNQEFTNWKDLVYDVIGSYPLFAQMYLNENAPKIGFFGWIRSTLSDNKNLENDFLFSDLIDLWREFMESSYMLFHIKLEIEKIENPICLNKNKKNGSIITTQSLFINNSQYFTIISDLILKGVITEKMEFIIPVKYEKRGAQFFICALMFQLDNKGYLKFCNDVDKVQALNNTFNVNISKQNYNAFLNSTNQDVYLSYTSFIDKATNMVDFPF
ncbi:hypothetical protein [Bizionia myxarmorum]|uniref:Uncharacterized protein n=1 Tax=Bizionia myxarmorum TaxID=291186 RepID=A0A5D0R0P8_9FLAO|nr:hypothetical protein [Bizionia myxarmorum]TYB74258.1 hypothetical protein ES674_13960 [Bizionia myxarmorum]